ncbi:MAG: phage tail tip lysozyme [Oscillospiraceae bacterium]|nr:phage tail tip lysozyme [Oscillospiraceae bacterium]
MINTAKRVVSVILMFTILMFAIPLNGNFNKKVYAASNEETIFYYLKNELGLNTAAACGILSNINSESSFNPTSSCIDTNGLTSYGICQWNGSRYNNLRTWCSDNGYSYSSLSGQLAFLKYELNTSYKTRYNYMKNNISNSASGAYEGGLYWAAKFEVCAEKYRNGRAVRARDVYWPKYGGHPPVIITPTISTDKESYIQGDTVNASWAASPSDSNISHYWINVIAPDGTWIHEGNMYLETSYSFIASQIGEYTVRIYATPKGSKEGEGSLSDEKKITVNSATWYGSLSPVNFGDKFDAVILAKEPWITLRSLGSENNYNVILQSEQGITSEMWRFERQSNGSYIITNFATGRVLDAYGLGTTDFTNVFTDEYNGGDNQKWFIYEKNGGYVLRPAYSDMVLDVDNAIFKSGTNIEIHTQNDSSAQTFALYYENPTYGIPKVGKVNANVNINEESGKYCVELNIDRGSYIDNQQVYRSKDKENWEEISSGKNENNLTIIDEGTDTDTTYYYKVKYSNRYYSIESDIVSIKTPQILISIPTYPTYEPITETINPSENITDEINTDYELPTNSTEDITDGTETYYITTNPMEETTITETEHTEQNTKTIPDIHIGDVNVTMSSAGHVISIPVYIYNDTHIDFSELGMEYEFDKNLKFEKVCEGELQPLELIKDNKLMVAATSSEDKNSSGMLYYIDFKLPDNLKGGDVFNISAKLITFTNSNEDSLKANVYSGAIKIMGPCTGETENTELTTDSFSNYGDINLDKQISIADAVLLNKYLVNSASLSEQGMVNADAYYDGKITSDDTLAILKLIVGTYDSLPVNP